MHYRRNLAQVKHESPANIAEARKRATDWRVLAHHQQTPLQSADDWALRVGRSVAAWRRTVPAAEHPSWNGVRVRHVRQPRLARRLLEHRTPRSCARCADLRWRQLEMLWRPLADVRQQRLRLRMVMTPKAKRRPVMYILREGGRTVIRCTAAKKPKHKSKFNHLPLVPVKPKLRAFVSRWHERRARKMGQTFRENMNGCGEFGAVVQCGCATRTAKALGCGTWKLCPRCAFKRRQQVYAMTLDAVAFWCNTIDRASCYMATFTIPHNELLPGQFEALRKMWPKMGRWLRQHLSSASGRKKGCNLVPMIAFREATDGCDDRGHVHLHVVIVARWLNYDDVKAQWLKIAAQHGLECNGYSVQFSRSETTGDTRLQPHELAKYVAKQSLVAYAGKQDDGKGLSNEHLVAWLDVTSGKRTFTASGCFWALRTARLCSCCARPFSVYTVGKLADCQQEALQGWRAADVAWRPPEAGDIAGENLDRWRSARSAGMVKAWRCGSDVARAVLLPGGCWATYVA